MLSKRVLRLTHRIRLATLVTFGVAGALPGEVTRIPVAVQIMSSQREIRMGENVAITVGLRDATGASVPARTPTTVTITTGLLPQPLTFQLAPGTATATQTVLFPNPGVAVLKATAPSTVPGGAIVIITRPASKNLLLHETFVPGAPQPTQLPQPTSPLVAKMMRPPASAKSEAMRHAELRSSAVAAPPPTLAATASPAPEPVAAVARLRLDVLPTRVHPRQGSWAASLHVVTLNRDGEPVVATEEVPVRFAATLGKIAPARVTIPTGAATHSEEVILTADAPGQDTVDAWTPKGTVQQAVEYENPIPTVLHVHALPERVENSGKSLVHITVLLLDELGHPASFLDHDVPVMLSTTRGELQPPNPVIIRRGMVAAEATLTSATAGPATISAFLAGIQSKDSNVLFVFPWLLVLLAAAGGLLGAIVRDITTTGFQWRRFGVDLIPGLVLGLVFYALTLFGAIGAIPKTVLPVNTTVIPTVNELGALLLGFLGGYIGARFLQPADQHGT